MTLREKLIVLRDKAGISQMTLAHQLGVSRQAVSRWESGDATPSMDKLKALAKIYGVSLDWLCSDASDAGALVQEKNLDERDPVCNSELPTEDKPKKRKKWAIIIGVISVTMDGRIRRGIYMKRKVIFTCTLCFLLCVCGCTPRTAGEIRRTDEESQADANAAGVVQGDSLKTPVENEATEWPTAEEIRTTIAAEQTEVYWLANAIQIPEQMNCYTVDALDMEMFWDTLKEKLQNGKGAIESGTLSIFNGAEQIQPVLEELSRVTGTAFVEVSVAEEDTTIQCSYAQAVDGIVLDTEGYTPGGGSEVIPGTRVDVYQDGRVSIQNPLRVGQKTRTLSKADLMDIEEVQDLCRIYYENCGLPCVTVVTGGGLVYYSSDGELRPAWSLEETWYPSENGHITSQMLDGQTGEYLRQ